MADQQATESSRQLAWAAMKPKLREAAADVERLLRDDAALIYRRWKLGAKIREIHGERARYGANAIELLAEYMDISPAVLYEARKVSDAFDQRETKRLALLRLNNGAPVTYAHLVVLAQIDDASEREAMIDRMVTGSLSAAALRELVGETGQPRKAGSGRRPKPPEPGIAGLRQMERQARSFARRLPDWEAHVLSRLTSMTVEDVDDPDELVTTLDALDQQLDEVARQLGAYQQQLAEGREHVQRLAAHVDATDGTADDEDCDGDDEESTPVRRNRCTRRPQSAM